MQFKRYVLLAAIAAGASEISLAGPYPSTGIPSSSSQLVEWANNVVSLTRGPEQLGVDGSPPASFGSASAATGVADDSVVSLGDGGQITLSFSTPITNGPGADFAVFENGFNSTGGVFAELGYVDVSSDGTNFFRFPSVSLTQNQTQVGSFGTIDPTNIHNLAGNFIALQGTEFDLQDMVGVSPLLNVNNIIDVRVTDVVGNVTNAGTFAPNLDSLGNIINDPFPTPFASGGFDLDAIGVINTPEPVSAGLLLCGAALLKRRRFRRHSLEKIATGNQGD